MRFRLLSISALFFFATAVFAKDVYLSIGGSVGVFRTDMRIFNPSSTKDIQVQAYYLPRGNNDNSAVQPVTITVPKRQMLSYDDVVSSLFHAGDIGAIRLKSDDDFVATQRIYAQQAASASCNVAGTLGQFVPGLDISLAMKQGVLIQLKSTGSNFRTNIGAVNPNSVAANVTWRLYDKSNTLIATGSPIAMPPLGVIGPSNMAGTFFFNPGTADLSDAWVSFSSDQPIFAYASVIDNGTTDPTFIPMSSDSGQASQSTARDTYLSIGGSVGVFRTDMRIFNPSSTKDIQVQAYYLPRGNTDNSGVQPMTITVPKRQMLSYNDVVSSLFHAGDIGAIRLKSDDDFVATQRIYAQQAASASCDVAGTLGQFVPGLDISLAMKQGVLIQLKSTGSNFRTNIGAVNPNSVAANVTWRLYDKSNTLIATGSPIAMPPLGVIGPSNMAGTFFFNPGTADLSDAWVTFSSDQPIFAYASVVDNGTTDPTFIPVAVDSGVPPAQSGAMTFNVTVQNFSIIISPAPNTLKVGDQVIFHITVLNSNHGFELDGPNGASVIPGAIFTPGTIIDKTFTVPSQGTYNYFCTNSGCGAHTGMTGSFDVGNPSTNPGPHY